MTRTRSGYKGDNRMPSPLLIVDSILVGGGSAAGLVGMGRALQVILSTPELQGMPLFHIGTWWVCIVVTTVMVVILLPLGWAVATVDAVICRYLQHQWLGWLVSALLVSALAIGVSLSWYRWIALGLPLTVDVERLQVCLIVSPLAVMARRTYVRVMQGKGRYRVDTDTSG